MRHGFLRTFIGLREGAMGFHPDTHWSSRRFDKEIAFSLMRVSPSDASWSLKGSVMKKQYLSPSNTPWSLRGNVMRKLYLSPSNTPWSSRENAMRKVYLSAPEGRWWSYNYLQWSDECWLNLSSKEISADEVTKKLIYPRRWAVKGGYLSFCIKSTPCPYLC